MNLPSGWQLTSIEPHFAAPIDLEHEVSAALAAPHTRVCPHRILVPAIRRRGAA